MRDKRIRLVQVVEAGGLNCQLKSGWYFPLVLFFFQASAKTYYVKNDGGAGNGTSDAQAWNYAKLNAAKLQPGDKVLLKRGEIFFGPLTITSGVAYAAYGRGANPIISGFKQVTGWRRYNANIWVSPSELPISPNLVLLNGKMVSMGRFPNGGYLPYTGHTGNTAISSAAIKSLPFDATGAEVVIRKERWILDRHWITTHQGGVLKLSAASPDGGNNSRQGVDKNGFFIQNHLATLDKEGEWYYDKIAKRLYIVCSALPQAVKVSAVDELLAISSKTGVSFTGIDVEGSNVHGASVTGSSGITFSNCRFVNHGQTGVYGIATKNLIIAGCRIENCFNNGIWMEWDALNTTVENTTVQNCGTVAGAGRSGDAAQEGIFIAGNNTIISNCKVLRTGYNGIHFNGSNARIENNTVDNFCLVKDDGGGIYAFEGDGVVVTNRLVRGNTVLHAVGAFAGAESYYYEPYGKAAGIYLDGNSNHTEVRDNVISGGPWAGFFVNNNSGNRFIGNLVIGHAMAIYLLESKAGTIRELVVKDNRLFGEKPLVVKLFVADNPSSLGVFSNNQYQKGKPILLEREYAGGGTQKLALHQWKTLGLDTGSVEQN